MTKNYSLNEKQNVFNSTLKYCNSTNNINLLLIMIFIPLLVFSLYCLIQKKYNDERYIKYQENIKYGLVISIVLLISILFYLFYLFFFINTDIGCHDYFLSMHK